MPPPPSPPPAYLAQMAMQQQEQMDKIEDGLLDQREKNTTRALKVTLGKEGAVVGEAATESASAAARALRAANVKVRVEPVTDMSGAAMGQNLVILKDDFTDHLQHGGLTDADKRAIQKSMGRLPMRLQGLRNQIGLASAVTFETNTSVQSLVLSSQGRVAAVTGGRAGPALSDSERAWIKRVIARVRRAEAAAATSLGLLATYEAVLNDGGDPKALDGFAEKTLASFPLAPAITDDDVNAYVAALPQNPAEMRARYDAAMRSLAGPQGNQLQDNVQAQMNAAMAQAQARAAAASPYATQPPPGAAPPSAYPPPGAATPPGSYPPPAANAPPYPNAPGFVGQARAGLDAATQARNGNLTGALDSAATMFPPDGTVGSSLRGLSAITRGDPKGAIYAALNLVPGGGLVKDALSFASGLLFGGGKKK